MSQRRRIILTEQSATKLDDGKYYYDYPYEFQGKQNKIINVIQAYVYNVDLGKFDISFSFHADFAFEKDNRYDGYVSLTNYNFKTISFHEDRQTQGFKFWFKVLSDLPVDLTNFKFIIEVECLF